MHANAQLTGLRRWIGRLPNLQHSGGSGLGDPNLTHAVDMEPQTRQILKIFLELLSDFLARADTIAVERAKRRINCDPSAWPAASSWTPACAAAPTPPRPFKAQPGRAPWPVALRAPATAGHDERGLVERTLARSAPTQRSPAAADDGLASQSGTTAGDGGFYCFALTP